MPETVAICTLLETSKRGLTKTLVPRWNQVDLGGREGRYIVCRHDADESTVNEWVGAASYPVRLVNVQEPEPLPFDNAPERRPFWTPHRLYRVAMMREAVRRAALDTEAEWLWWLDSDIDPEGGQYPSFGCLHQVLTSTTGWMAPTLASGLYCTRFGGLPISQWLEGIDRRYLPLLTGQVRYSRVAGFGCMLMHRSTAEAISWAGYRDHLEEAAAEYKRGTPDAGHLGEDCYALRLNEERIGVPAAVDHRVTCRHYHADGSYWAYRDEGGILVPCYSPATGSPHSHTVRYTGAETLTWPILGRTIEPGAVVELSPEILLTFETVIPDDYEVLKEAA